MVILHEARKTIQNRFLCFFRKKDQTPVLKKNGLKKTCELFSLNPVFFNPDYLSIFLLIFP